MIDLTCVKRLTLTINTSCDVHGDYPLNKELKVNGLHYDLPV